MDYAWVGLGGFLGALARHGVGKFFFLLTGAGFPWGTMAANITGSLLLGVIQVLGLERFLLSPRSRFLLGVGFCGAYTTFSTFTKETLVLIHDELFVPALLYIGGTVVLCLLGAWLGMVLGRGFAVALESRERAMSQND